MKGMASAQELGHACRNIAMSQRCHQITCRGHMWSAKFSRHRRHVNQNSCLQARAGQGNLGALSHIVENDTNIEFTLPNLEAFEPGVHFDAPAVFGSGILLLVLLGLMFERVLGLDKYLVGIVTKWKWARLAKERERDVADRARLERMYDKPDE